MTAAKSPAVHSVDEFVFSVPDLAEARRFYCAFGLDVREVDGGLGLYTHGHPHRWARVLQGSEPKRLLWVSYGIHAGDLGRFEQHLREQEVGAIDPPAAARSAADRQGLWIAGPDSLPLRLVVADKCSPSGPPPREAATPCSNQGRSPGRSKVHPVRPLFLSHILMFSANVDTAVAFYERVLGLRLSDKSGSVIAFMHTPHGSDHHLIALALSGGYGLHHSSWSVPSIDAIGIGSDQMAAAGFERGWGLGRHVLGSNYFRYVRDPWGSYAEYSFDIDHVEAGAEWPAADHPPEDSLYVWGPAVPEDFIVNHELIATAGLSTADAG